MKPPCDNDALLYDEVTLRWGDFGFSDNFLFCDRICVRDYGDTDDTDMEDNCTMRPCATDFSIAAIMSRHGRARTSRCRDRDPPDPMSPLGKQ